MSRYYNDYYGLDSSSLEFEHFGIKGQKHGERRYQNEDGSLTPLGRIHYGVGAAREAATILFKGNHKNIEKQQVSEEEKRKQKEAAKVEAERKAEEEKSKAETAKVEAERKAEEEKARAEAEVKAKADADKKRAINSGVASEVMKYAGQMDNNELQYAVNRVNTMQQLNAYNAKEIEAAQNKTFDTLAKVGSTALKIGDGLAKASTTYATLSKNLPIMAKDFDKLKNAKAYKEQAEAAAKAEAKKKKAINSALASEVMKYAGQMDNTELQAAINRIDLMKKLNGYK